MSNTVTITRRPDGRFVVHCPGQFYPSVQPREAVCPDIEGALVEASLELGEKGVLVNRETEAACEAIPVALLRKHWPTVICDHDAKTDRAQCSCCTYEPPVCASVGAAVESWLDHLRAFGLLRDAPPIVMPFPLAVEAEIKEAIAQEAVEPVVQAECAECDECLGDGEYEIDAVYGINEHTTRLITCPKCKGTGKAGA